MKKNFANSAALLAASAVAVGIASPAIAAPVTVPNAKAIANPAPAVTSAPAVKAATTLAVKAATNVATTIASKVASAEQSTKAATQSTKSTTSSSNAMVNVNTATKAQLVAVKGIGPKLAASIIAHRPYANAAGLEKALANVVPMKTVKALEPKLAF